MGWGSLELAEACGRAAPLVWFRVPLAICCEGRSGVWRAEMADDAAGPEVAEPTACGRVVVMPVAGSALPGGQRPRAGFFRVAQLPSDDVALLAPFVCAEVMVEVEVVDEVELVEAREEDEFCRWTVFRAPGVKVLVTSSELMVL